jgi:hypothetical protein
MLRFLSYNIERRVLKEQDELFVIVKNVVPHVVALQECTMQNSEEIIRQMKKMNLVYFRFNDNFSKREGEILFTSLATRDKYYKVFTRTLQQRALSVYEVKFNDRVLMVCTAKLETGDGSIPIKKAQLCEIETMCTTTPILFGGDTSLEKWHTLELPLLLSDAWRENGTTRNFETTSTGDRPDRFLYFGMECVEYQTIPLEGRNAIFGVFKLEEKV